jgi:hypothetical protein
MPSYCISSLPKTNSNHPLKLKNKSYMIKCKLTLTDWFTKKVSKKVIMPKDPSVAAQIHSKNNPNCHVLVEWIDEDGPKQTVELPYNIMLDQLLVDEGDMSINRFTTKWYGKVSKAKLKAIEKELAKEFVEEEEEQEDPEMIIIVD